MYAMITALQSMASSIANAKQLAQHASFLPISCTLAGNPKVPANVKFVLSTVYFNICVHCHDVELRTLLARSPLIPSLLHLTAECDSDGLRFNAARSLVALLQSNGTQSHASTAQANAKNKQSQRDRMSARRTGQVPLAGGFPNAPLSPAPQDSTHRATANVGNQPLFSFTGTPSSPSGRATAQPANRGMEPLSPLSATLGPNSPTALGVESGGRHHRTTSSRMTRMMGGNSNLIIPDGASSPSGDRDRCLLYTSPSPRD